MKEYIIRGIIDLKELYYAGMHYQNTKAFTSSVYTATKYHNIDEARMMAEVLTHYFNKTFSIVQIQVTITVV